MSWLDKISAEWPVRIGTALMYLYSGYDIMMHPKSWLWALPQGLKQLLDATVGTENYLRFQGGSEIVMAIIFILPFMPRVLVKWVAALSALEMAGILLFEVLPFPWGLNNMTTTFRDLGLAGGSATLFLLLRKPSLIHSP
jgi:hypothetical protein